jgi:leader peptidase (prepilin peptidase)/N-methyltransferase
VNVALAAAALAPGLAVGSFLNVVASRVPRKLPIGRTRSACMSCGVYIQPVDNIPLLSYLRLGGGCRACSAAIPLRYPLVEAGTALLVAACFLRFGATAYAVLAALFCVVLVALAAIDLEHRIVPNRIVIPAWGALLAAHTVVSPSPEWALGGLGAALFFFLAALAYPRGMGMGDVKLCLLLGAMLGRHVVVALAIGMVVAILPAVVSAARGGPVRKLKIPFVPFLALGSVVALFWGETLLEAYLGLF